jgi:hypothetical protein
MQAITSTDHCRVQQMWLPVTTVVSIIYYGVEDGRVKNNRSIANMLEGRRTNE